MNRFEQEYKNKLITIDEALSMVKSNDYIWTSYNALEPVQFMKNLHKIKDRVENVSLKHAGLFNPYEFYMRDDMDGHFLVMTSFYDSYTRKVHANHVNTFIPGHMHNGYVRTIADRHINIFVGTATSMDKHGYVRFSLNNINEIDAVYNADLVIMEINPNLPVTPGVNEVHISDIDYVVETNEPLITIEDAEPNELDMKIGSYVASLVEDGSTIQLGIGKIPNAVSKFLTEKNDLGVHTEMITSSIAHLSDIGVINGKKKNLHPRKIVGNFALGSQKLYDFLDHNPSVMIFSSAYTNDPCVIAQNDNMISINTAIQVDLTGQVCSESVGYKQISGTGGASDFAVGASHSKNGKSIIAIRSTAKKGKVSTIQPLLNQGAAVSISRNDIDYVVTEYGIAFLRGRTIRERVDALINIAHPDFRDELEMKSKEYLMW